MRDVGENAGAAPGNLVYVEREEDVYTQIYQRDFTGYFLVTYPSSGLYCVMCS